MLWSISIQLMWDRREFPERARRAAASGFDLVDLWDWRTSDIDAVHAACADSGIGINGFFGTRDTSLCDAEARSEVLDEVKRNLDVAVRVGARQLHVFSNAIRPGGVVVPGPEQSREALLDTCVSTLDAAADIVSGSGVSLVLEHLNTVFLPGYLWDDARVVADIARRLGRAEEVGAVFDTFHQQLTHGRLTDSLLETLPWLSRVDFAQVPGRFEPGQGEIDLGYLLGVLKDQGWDKTLTFEAVPRSGDPSEAVAAIRELIRRHEDF